MMGPLLKLKWFGWICPCHECDEEHQARIGVCSLQQLAIDWIRANKDEDNTIMTSTLSIVDHELGPAIQVTSHCESVPNNEKTEADGKPLFLLLDKVDKVVLKEEDDNDGQGDGEIQLYGSKSNDENGNAEAPILLRFRLPDQSAATSCIFGAEPVTLEDVFHHLRAVIHWDHMRRLEVLEEVRRHEASMRLQEETMRLLQDSTQDLT